MATLILAMVTLETVVLTLRYRSGRGSAPSQWASPLIAGAALALALLFTQRELSAVYVAGALLVAGIAHLAGYAQRWKAP